MLTFDFYTIISLITVVGVFFIVSYLLMIGYNFSIVEMSKNPENESYRLKKMRFITAITFLFFIIYITTLFIFLKKLIKF